MSRCRIVMGILRGLALCLALLVSLPAQAVTFAAGLENTQWQLDQSPFMCRLSHNIPAFGEVVFEHEAGEPLKFYLEALQREMLQGSAELVAEAPAWRPGEPTARIGKVNLNEGERAGVASREAELMLASLYQGKVPTFSAPQWRGSNETLRVQVSSVNFKAAYQDYMGCVAQLLPVNFRQIARTAVLFNAAEWELSDAAKERLKVMAHYLSVDKEVHSIYIDGHSDSQGRRLLNRDLSKKRAQEVTAFLVKLGIPENMIITRFHGERYPVVDNKTPENRARNRRVTIRLDREDQELGLDSGQAQVVEQAEGN